ncbi:hypothetical protein RPPS3_25760 [Rhodopseudomonas palustris]|uniref:hypothetical protein n=1 Tax=Rhodopseudomonas palustris TaxID=1076 RepID=UPI000D1B5AE8|nr:hypothetical protein [Rhodopseudomonas palustris]AVT76639.1 hypothetical protein RPPS3_25760 [Rhodopseudomonas palustris]
MSDQVEVAASDTAKPIRQPEFTRDPDGSLTRTLIKPIQGHGDKVITAIRLRPPRYSDIMAHGDPTQIIAMVGALLPQTDMGIVAKYIAALSIDAATGDKIDPGLLEQTDYRDALALTEAVKDFFRAASQTPTTPPTS